VTEPTPDPEIVEADPRARRLAFLVVVWFALTGAVCLAALSRSDVEFQALLASWLPLLVAHPWLPALAMLLLASPIIFVSAVMFRIGGRTVAAERYPPPGVVVARATTLVRGAAARRRGRWLQGLSALLSIAVGGMAITVWRLFEILAGAC